MADSLLSSSPDLEEDVDYERLVLDNDHADLPIQVLLQLAEMERQGGFTSRNSPFMEGKDLGAFLNGAKFTMLIINTDDMNVCYVSIFPPVVCLDATKAFNALALQEQLDSHFISRSSWYGGLVVLFQTSPESPHIFRLIHNINTGQDLASLKAAALEAGATEEEVTAYFIYCSEFYANMGK